MEDVGGEAVVSLRLEHGQEMQSIETTRDYVSISPWLFARPRARVAAAVPSRT